MEAPGRERRRKREKDSKAQLGELPGPEKVADKPHPLTILLSSSTIVSVIVAIVALAVNYKVASESLKNSRTALQLNQKGLEIGQRAYVSVHNGRFAVGIDGSSGTNELVFRYTAVFDLRNFGNTPADVESIVLRCYISEMPWRRLGVAQRTRWDSIVENDRDGPRHLRFTKKLGDIGPASSAQVWLQFEAVPPLTDNLLEDHKLFDATYEAARLEGVVTYKDVFGQRHAAQWCWEPGVAQEQGQARDCKQAGEPARQRPQISPYSRPPSR